MKQNKFLIGAGCSYGKVAFALNQWKEYLDIDDDTLYKFYNDLISF